MATREAPIEEAIKSPLFILTGGPGTGKQLLSMGLSRCLRN